MTDQESADAALSAFVEAALAQALALRDGDEFLAWARSQAPDLFPDLFALMPDERAARQLATALGRGIWNATPLPRNGFRPAPLATPERNSVCACGSGVKYKRCCALATPPSEFSREELMPLVLRLMPEAELTRLLAEGRTPLPVLEDIAQRLLGDGRCALVVQLLEPLLQEPRLGLQHQGLLDALLDAYLEADLEAVARAALEQLLRRVRPPLASLLRSRQAQILHHAGEHQNAWAALEQAGRNDPDRAELGRVEVMFLLVESRFEEASARAAHWLARLRRQGYQDDEQPMPFLDEVRADPELVMKTWSEEDDELIEPAVLARLAALAEAASERPLPMYGLTRLAEDRESAWLEAPPAVRTLELQWATLWRAGKPLSTEMQVGFTVDAADVWADPEPWLGFLERSPVALDSLEILDDLCLATAGFIETATHQEPLLSKLAARGAEILRLAWVGGGAARLPWVLPGNRPALRLAVREAGALLDADKSAAIEYLAWLLEVNPEDDHGLRCVLADRYLRAGRNAETLELAERFPQDPAPETVYGRVLALYRLDRKGEARVALGEAIAKQPHVFEYLLAENPKKLRAGPRGAVLGDEAWLYQGDCGDLWSADRELLRWLELNGNALCGDVAVRGGGP